MNKIEAMKMDAERVKQWLNSRYDRQVRRVTGNIQQTVVRVGDESWHRSYERALTSLSGTLTSYINPVVEDVSIYDGPEATIVLKVSHEGWCCGSQNSTERHSPMTYSL